MAFLALEVLLITAGIIIFLQLVKTALWTITENYKLRKIPGPFMIPLVGNAYYFINNWNNTGIFKILHSLSNSYSYTKILKLWIGPKVMIFVRHPSAAEKVLTSPCTINKDPIYFEVFKDWTRGVFVAKHNEWLHLRKMANLTFTSKSMEQGNYIGIINEQINILVKRLDSVKNCFTDPHDMIGACLMDITFRTHWGAESNEQEKEHSILWQTMKENIPFIIARASNPLLHSNLVYKCTTAYRQSKKNISMASKELEKIIRKKDSVKGEPKDDSDNQSSEVYFDLITNWLRSNGDVSLSSRHIYTSDMLVAGSDTSSGILTQMLFHIASEPDIQKKIIEEVDEIFGEDKRRDVTKEDIFRMTYTDMVLNETLRQYCPAGIMRTSSEDITLDTGEVIPKGSTIYIMIYSIHRDPIYWERPKTFYPEHFLPEAKKSRPKFSFIPFSAGSRNCPGKLYSKWVAKTLVAQIFRKYSIETDRKPDFDNLNYFLVMEPKNGFSLKFVPRQVKSIRPFFDLEI